MIRTAAFALFVTQTIASAALAQSAPSTAEYGRAFGGEVTTLTKHGSTFSGSIGLTHSSRGGDGFDLGLGGSLIKDRLWFFASATSMQAINFESRIQAVDGSVTAQPVDWSSVSASFSERRNAIFSATPGSPAAFPSSFLALRSTSILSDTMVVNISVSRQTLRPVSTSPFDFR